MSLCYKILIDICTALALKVRLIWYYLYRPVNRTRVQDTGALLEGCSLFDNVVSPVSHTQNLMADEGTGIGEEMSLLGKIRCNYNFALKTFL